MASIVGGAGCLPRRPGSRIRAKEVDHRGRTPRQPAGRIAGNSPPTPAPCERERSKPAAERTALSWGWLSFFAVVVFVAAYYLGHFSGNFTGDSLDPVVNRLTVETAAPRIDLSLPTAQRTSTSGQPAALQIVIQNMRFSPARLEVQRGDTVEWKNEDLTPHTATSPGFDSQVIEPEQSWRHTFGVAGEFPYACTFHPDMVATIVVK